jgi:hypothetical protein
VHDRLREHARNVLAELLRDALCIPGLLGRRQHERPSRTE